MRTNFRSVILAISLLFALATSISAAPGDLDPTFGNGGIVISRGGSINTLEDALGMALQADGKIVAVGYGAASGSSWDFAVARYHTDGSPDTSFGGSGVVVTPLSNCNDFALSIAIQADGKIVVAGFATNSVQNCDSGPGNNFAVVRYNPNGSLDTTFNGTGKVITPINASSYARSVAIQADGKIVVAGDSYDSSTGGFTLVRYNTNGSLDTSFDNDGIVTTGVGGAFAVAIQADGKIVAAGTGVIRYNADGSLDTTFNGTGIVTTPDSGAYSVAIQADGKILTANGNGTTTSGNRLVRYNANGTPDTSFNGTGSVAVGIYVDSAVVQADGKIVAAGYTEFGEGSAFAVIRLNGNGSLDATFGGTGTVVTPIVTQVYYSSGANAVAIQPDGKIVAAGGVVDRGFDLFDFAFVRYQGDAPSSSCSSPNPIDCPDFFIRQQYRDFLGREPESSCPPGQCGLDFYLPILNGCGDNVECMLYTRGGLSANFFRSPEFGQKGGYVANLFSIVIGQRPKTVAELNDASKVERPHYTEFTADLATLSAPTDAETNLKKDQLAVTWLQRPEVQSILPNSLSNQQFVQKLETIAGVTLANESALIANLDSGAMSRAQVLRAVAESPEVIARFYTQNFVTMEYFGYLRRDPEDCHASMDPANCGYIFHNSRFNTPGADPDLIENIIVRGFIESPEYRHRFGP